MKKKARKKVYVTYLMVQSDVPYFTSDKSRFDVMREEMVLARKRKKVKEVV